MGSFVVADAALAGLKVLSAVNRKDRRMFALERGGRSGVRGAIGPHARERPHPRRRPGKDGSVEGLPVSGSGWVRPPRRGGRARSWRMTASLRAAAPFAFLKSAPFAILRPQAFREAKPVCRVRMTLVRLHRGGFVSAPRLEIRSLRLTCSTPARLMSHSRQANVQVTPYFGADRGGPARLDVQS